MMSHVSIEALRAEWSHSIDDIAAGHGEAMDGNEISALCEKVNLSPSEVEISITVDGGVIQAIDGIPPGVQIHVMDFDVNGPSEEDVAEMGLKQNAEGEYYSEGVWTHGE